MGIKTTTSQKMCQKTVPARKLQKLQLQENMHKAIIARKYANNYKCEKLVNINYKKTQQENMQKSILP